jgi:peptidoglycan/LPS O-acetylase OafA/YrhL
MHVPVSTLTAQQTAYRPDIDGLRAFAVLSVLAYHYGGPLPVPGWLQLPGGFTGVDVFFVISGFLITSKLRDDIAAGEFSILGFYDRRIRRILPALLVMLAVTLFAGKFLLMPGDYKTLAASAAAAAFGVSNLFFLAHTGYFDQSANLLPLLHTWSLAVEEQFYVAWPPLLFLIAAGHKRIDIAAIIGAIVIVGFGASLFWFDFDPKAAFFTAIPRAWELALGALLVFLPPLTCAIGEIATALGLAVIGAGFVVVSDASFPGIAALYPCAGAALVIWPRRQETRSSSWLGRLRPIGLISYSLYLWHWPVWVLFRIYIDNGTPRIREALALAVVSILLATLSYRFVEQPFRKRRWQPAQSVQAGLFACGVIFCVSMYIDSKEGMPERIPPLFAAMQSPDVMWEWPCDRQKVISDLEGTWCVFGAPWNEAKTKGVLWGDSHAMHFAPIIASLARRNGAAMMLYEQCAPPIDSRRFIQHVPNNPLHRQYCEANHANIIAALKAHDEIKLVVLAAWWISLPAIIYTNIDTLSNVEIGSKLLEDALNQVLDDIAKPDRRVVIITSVPQWSHDPLPCELLNAGVLRRPCASDQAAVPRAEFDAQLSTVSIIKRVASKHPGTIVIDAGEQMCRGERCVAELNGEPLYRDTSHIRRNLTEKTKEDFATLIRLDRIFH